MFLNEKRCIFLDIFYRGLLFCIACAQQQLIVVEELQQKVVSSIRYRAEDTVTARVP